MPENGLTKTKNIFFQFKAFEFSDAFFLKQKDQNLFKNTKKQIEIKMFKKKSYSDNSVVIFYSNLNYISQDSFAKKN
ncbi:hypothetical protein B0A66_14880 [Flavobacterium hercynium]|uniref:Uncharacterized protein n=1 Tax=Flavobacterium hercynium TaxID=387094 RepID=A0A226H304_9FLAO|nr:hypothetical protein B0A66_14880 [Flavobacterium hercynium]